MSNRVKVGRRCAEYKKVYGESGVVDRCARYAHEGEVDEGSDGAFGDFDGAVSIPGLGALDWNLNGMDVIVGGGAGMIGGAILKWVMNNVLKQEIPAFLQNLMPLVGGIAVGSALYFFEKKGNKSRAKGHLFGAIALPGAVNAWNMLRVQFPDYFGDVVALKYGGYGIHVNEATPRLGPGGYSGLIVNEPARALSGFSYGDQAGMADLAAVSMGDDCDGDTDVEYLMGA